ncbi:Ca-activated chloride channel family protein [Gracilibacillus ureilyticus]|uniref:Ca-activated chloride channel family protein n=1 Tax=Gracilibacillus ureilyticus TaxID=531814 RepID=A0A1H9U4P1_9BACI|nr:VWA domain-containing protein [Gracilibacillus ureilyticus]SES04530.1 Ca-activated chloride channel family protein [Gracilibacillus ureilyticus]
MKISRLLGYGLIICILFIAGCSNDTNNQENEEQTENMESNNESTETANAEAKQVTNDNYLQYVTEDPEEMVQLEPGPYSGDNYDLEAIKKEIEGFPSGESKDDYYYRFISLIAEDYRFFYEAMQDVDTSYDTPTAQPDGELSTPEGVVGPKMNVQILLDSSGSMEGEIDGISKMELAKDAVQSFVEELPEEAQVSLRVYGHKGTSDPADWELSCSSSEQIYPLGEFNQEEFTASLEQFSPAGWTPLAKSMEEAMNDLKDQTGENVNNIIYIVSDGMETCDGDPVETAKSLNQSEIEAIVNIIGFDLDDEGQDALKEVAEAGNGEYSTVDSKEELQRYFEQAKRDLRSEWQSWSNENVSHYIESQSERVNALFDTEKEARELAKIERERIEEIAAYWNEQLSEVESDLEIRPFEASKRQRGLRSYLFNTSFSYRKELISKGLDLRNEIRDKASEERDNLKNE